MPAQLTWVGGSLNSAGQYTGGDPTAWSNPLNWLQGATPQAGDTVLFTNNVTETYTGGSTHQGPENVNSNDDLANLSLAALTVDSTSNSPGSSGATISVNNPLAITGNLVLESPYVTFGGNGAMSIGGGGSLWTAGTLQIGTGGLQNNGTLTLDSANIPNWQGEMHLRGAGTSLLEATSFSNTGTVTVHSGAINVGASVAQVSGSTLTGGFWEAFGSSTVPATLTLSGSPSLTTIAKGTVVELSGPGSSFSNLSALNTIAGKLEVLSGASFSTAVNLTVSGSGLLYVGAGSTLSVNGNFNLTSKATLQIGLGGTSKAPTIGQLQATGTVTLAGKLKLTTASKPAVGSTFQILNNEGSAAISGIFAGLPEGATFVVNGMTFKISYVGGTGNDVTITRVK
jgi:hypothetical protein